MTRVLFLLSFLFSNFCGHLFADVIVLKSGKVIEGKILKDDERVVEIQVGSVRLKFEKSKLSAIERGETAESVYAKRLAELRPDDYEGHINLARFCEERGMSNEAIVLYRKALKLKPDNKGIRQKLSELTASQAVAIWRSAEKLLEGGKFDSAVSEYQNLIQFYPEAMLVPQAHYRIGLIRERLGDYSGAEQALKMAISSSPDELDFHRALSQLYIEREEWGNLVKHCQTHLRGGVPQKLQSFLTEKLELAREGESLSKRVNAQPADAGTAVELAEFFERIGFPEKALKTLRTAQSRGAESTRLLRKLGLMLQERDRFAEAHSFLLKALNLERDPQDREKLKLLLRKLKVLSSVPIYFSKPDQRAKILAELKAVGASWREVARALRTPTPKPLRESGLIQGECFSPSGGTRVRYSLYIPESYDGKRRLPLLISLHGAKGTGEAELRGFLTTLGKPRFFILCPTIDYSTGALDSANAVIKTLRETFKLINVNTERVYISGISAGGVIAWRTLVDYPWFFAGAYLRSTRPEDIVELRVANLFNIPVFIIHGSEDKVISVEHARRVARKLEALDARVRFEEKEGFGHSGFFREAGEALRWLFQFKRPSCPEKIKITGWEPANSSLYWVSVLQYSPGVFDPYRPIEVTVPGLYKLDKVVVRRMQLSKVKSILGRVEARVSNNTISLKTKYVRKLRVYLPGELIEFDLPVELVVNGRTYLRKKFEPSIEGTLESALRNLDPALSYPASFTMEIRD